MLDELGERPLRVFIVWEPVIATDLAPPTTAVLGRVSDPRASQYWDPANAISRSLRRTATQAWKKLPVGEDLRDAAVVWDYVLVFPAGGDWSDAGPSPPDFGGGTVVDVMGEAKAHLSALSKP